MVNAEAKECHGMTIRVEEEIGMRTAKVNVLCLHYYVQCVPIYSVRHIIVLLHALSHTYLLRTCGSYDC